MWMQSSSLAILTQFITNSNKSLLIVWEEKKMEISVQKVSEFSSIHKNLDVNHFFYFPFF
jgi:hypothetical protein